MIENNRNLLSKVLNYTDQIRSHWRTSRRIKREARHVPLRVVVGASGIIQPGWVHTDKEHLNIADPRCWKKYFRKNTIAAILAEHVWEHLTPEEATTAAFHCFRFLKPGGYLRAAVPDGFHPDPKYIEWVRPGGRGPGSDDHKVLYTYDTFCEIFTSVGFKVSLCEYFDERREFHSIEWNPDDGMIRRSKRFDGYFFDRRSSGGQLKFTSIIIDARKPPNHRD